MKGFLKNFSYTFLSNIMSLIISSMITFIVPKFLNVESYGYFQLYLFYINYIGFFHFGWCDGVFLRYAGEYYDKLDKKLFSGQFYLLTFFEMLIGTVIMGYGYFFVSDETKWFVIACVGISTALIIPKCLLQYLLQGTNRIKEYAVITMIEKIITVIGIILLLVMKYESYKAVIAADLAGKLSALIYSALCCKDIIFERPCKFKKSVMEAIVNVKVGINLMLANIAGFLIIGLVRMAIEKKWDIATFGKISLTISISNLLLVVIKAVANVIFPLLKRMSQDKYSETYRILRDCMMIPLLGMLVFYYPIRIILSSWLPNYADSLKYMALLFPICIYESKETLLITTYLKALRKEKWLLAVNAVTVLFSALLSYISVFVLQNLDVAIISIVILLAGRCIVSEVLLTNLIENANLYKNIMLENILSVLFIITSWCIGGIFGLILYTVCYLIYLFIKRNSILKLAEVLKRYVKSR